MELCEKHEVQQKDYNSHEEEHDIKHGIQQKDRDHKVQQIDYENKHAGQQKASVVLMKMKYTKRNLLMKLTYTTTKRL